MNNRRIGVITGSSRPHRRSHVLAQQAIDTMSAATPELAFEIIDLAEVSLPFFDEALPPRSAQYSNEHTKRWAELIDSFDGFVFVVPEYNGSYPAVLKNAIDYLAAEWRNKPAAIIAYGASGGASVANFLTILLERIGMTVLQPTITATTDVASPAESASLAEHSEALQALALALGE